MRAHGKEGRLGRRFAIVIGVAAAGVMTLGAQTATAAPEVVKYDTKLTIVHDQNLSWGTVKSKALKCERRRVVLFKKRRGADRKLLSTESYHRSPGVWRVPDHSIRRKLPPGNFYLYAKVRREVNDEFVCRRDRSERLRWGE